MSVIVKITNVSKGKNKFHLDFKGYIPSFDTNKEYTFEFYGPGVKNDYISDSINDQLAEKLGQDFGYPPFDVNVAKAALGVGKRYEIDRL